MSNVEYNQGERLQIRLIRTDASSPWGFRLQGGIDFNTPLSIQSVSNVPDPNIDTSSVGDAFLL